MHHPRFVWGAGGIDTHSSCEGVLIPRTTIIHSDVMGCPPSPPSTVKAGGGWGWQGRAFRSYFGQSISSSSVPNRPPEQEISYAPDRRDDAEQQEEGKKAGQRNNRRQNRVQVLERANAKLKADLDKAYTDM